jgi:protein-L-isoaspartate(D-aspartate) O-methyltransferase
MVTEQLVARDIVNPAVLRVMRAVPRHEFVPASLREQGYDDGPLPIGFGQTISQPYIVAFMTQALQPQGNEVVLEVGTGSGYQTAVLAHLVKRVYTLEIVPALAQRAVAAFRRLGLANIDVGVGDGYDGWPAAAPFDAIIVTCAPEHVPPPLVAQLNEGGRLIIPVGPADDQALQFLQKEGGQVRQREVLAVRFVPMTGRGLG